MCIAACCNIAASHTCLVISLIHQLHLQKFFTFLRNKNRGYFCMSADDDKNVVVHVTDPRNCRRPRTCMITGTGQVNSLEQATPAVSSPGDSGAQQHLLGTPLENPAASAMPRLRCRSEAPRLRTCTCQWDLDMSPPGKVLVPNLNVVTRFPKLQ